MKRQPFSPARLVLGLSLLAIAVAHLTVATGHWEAPLPVLLPLVPLALLLATLTAAFTQLVRYVRTCRSSPTRSSPTRARDLDGPGTTPRSAGSEQAPPTRR